MKYFAYGSNMLSRRLKSFDRCPDAVFLGPAYLCGYALRFHKKSSQDGSGKANVIVADAASIVHGVIYDLNTANKSQLARAEGVGKGYQECGVELITPQGTLRALTFAADPDAIDNTLKPFDWYLDLVIAGAKEHRLPPDYIAQLESIPTIKDLDEDRVKRAVNFMF